MFGLEHVRFASDSVRILGGLDEVGSGVVSAGCSNDSCRSESCREYGANSTQSVSPLVPVSMKLGHYTIYHLDPHIRNRGLEQISKALKLSFEIPAAWTGRAVVVVPPPILLHTFTRPAKLPGSEITNILGLIETMQLPYVISDPTSTSMPFISMWWVEKCPRSTCTSLVVVAPRRSISPLARSGGRRRNGRPSTAGMRVAVTIAWAPERMMLGLPIGRDKELLDASGLYANSGLLGVP